ncbi:hypothetical protein QM306_37870, partial [Burkholderia cenocepacia]|nr:hypothetical protein [Burkholderia cenocepacia]
AGSLYQKGKLAQSDLRTAVAVQNFGAAIVAAVFVLLLHETRWIDAPPDRNTTPHTSDTHSAGASIQR